MSIPDSPPRYQVLVLRCWEEHSEHASAVWRFSVQDPDTNQRRGFASLEALVAFLTNQFGAQGMQHGENTSCQRKEVKSCTLEW